MEVSEKMDNGTNHTMENNTTSNAVKNCALCGCSTPAVKCDKCNSQTFCLSCDDMYHRHPKRRFHLRKAVDSIWNTYRSPRLRRRTELPGDPSKIPIPPPRTKKRHFSSNMFNPGFEVPMFGYKGFWHQKKLMETQKLSPDVKTSLSVSPEPSSENAMPNQDVNTVNENASNKAADTTQALQRRSSADNPNAIPNPSLPIHVFVPGVGPMPVDMQGRSALGYPESLPDQGIHHSASATDLTAVTSPHQMPPAYHFPPHMHAFMHPHLNPYPPSLAHFNCPQCISASWSNLMSPNMAAYHQLHMHQQQPWAPPQSPESRVHNSPAPEAVSRPDNSPLSYQASSSLFSSPVFPYPNGGSFSPNIQAKHEQTIPMNVQEQSITCPVSSPSEQILSAEMPSQPEPQLQQTISSSDEMEEDEVDNADDDDGNFTIPEKPTVEWACVHCTYVNPPGSHICEVCCKTSYTRPKETKKSTKRKREQKQAKEDNAEKKMDKTGQNEKQPLAECGELNVVDAEMPTSHFSQKVMQL